ncbi:myelin-oligodendrocyte glycoprotein isoform X1 [Lates calcarifer]|uniref:Myelin-oligodendrocyte glycoprotein isoform X1 n=1 Tax=Lates calcarifer TaxID=8187 RepID=A0AAJ7Q2E0_LATCA|nr:myelin-oligodendrocyte glycoprotein isoform X1 [Lates calcarifer]
MDIEELGYKFSLSPLILRLTLVACLLLFTCTPAGGQYRVIGSNQPIEAAPGDDVVLPCCVDPPQDVVGLTVEWSKPDLRPDPRDRLSRVHYVHLYRDAREVPDMKIPSYMMRTALFAEGLRQGNISLKITNVTLEDGGRYRCFIPKLKSQMQSSIVHLVVKPAPTKAGTTETPLFTRNLQTPDPEEEKNNSGDFPRRSRLMLPLLFLLIVVGVAAGYLQMQRSKKTKEDNDPKHTTKATEDIFRVRR